MWSENQDKGSNFHPRLLKQLAQKHGGDVGPEDLFSYVVAIT
ncbi:MAG: hypothetical protein IIB59_01210, partial [Planctomycetes bacterium]|nr:hypothetical protein [Planctomycetota bacterium]